MKRKNKTRKFESKFRFLEDIAIAEVAFEAYGRSFSELLENAGLALESVQVDLKTVRPKRVERLMLNSDTLEDLLFYFLEELIFLKDAKRFIFSKIDCEVEGEPKKGWQAKCLLYGEEIDSDRHKLGADVKAVTRHLFKIWGNTGKFSCRVILDI